MSPLGSLSSAAFGRLPDALSAPWHPIRLTHPSRPAVQGNCARTVSQLLSLAKAMGLKQAHEAKMAMRYDAVLAARHDLVFRPDWEWVLPKELLDSRRLGGNVVWLSGGDCAAPCRERIRRAASNTASNAASNASAVAAGCEQLSVSCRPLPHTKVRTQATGLRMTDDGLWMTAGDVW